MRKVLIISLTVLFTLSIGIAASAETETTLILDNVQNPDIQILSQLNEDEGAPSYRQAAFSLEGDGSVNGAFFSESRYTGRSDTAVNVEGGFTAKGGDFESNFSSMATNNPDDPDGLARTTYTANVLDAEGVTEDSLTVAGRSSAIGTGGVYESINGTYSSQRFDGEGESATINSHRSGDSYFTSSADVTVEVSGEEEVSFFGGTTSGSPSWYGSKDGLSYYTEAGSSIDVTLETSFSYTEPSLGMDWVSGSTTFDEGGQLSIPDFSNYEGFNGE